MLKMNYINENDKLKTSQKTIQKSKTQRGKLSLNIIQENNDILKNAMNDVELYNAKYIFKGDLSEIFQDVIKNNKEFKDNIFFTNVGNTEQKIGDLDDIKKSHTFKEFPTSELLTGYMSYEDLFKKYMNRAKKIRKEDKKPNK